jgi:hypothetical protein
LFRDREDNVRQPPRAEGMAPESWLYDKESKVSLDKPQISEGSEPVKLLDPNDKEITSPAAQLTPGHTGDEHFEATLAQVQAGS